MSSSSPVVDGQPATWEQYFALPEDPRVEFIGGRLRVRPQASRRHQRVTLALATTLAEAIPPGYDVTPAWAWRVGDDEFVPDVMVHAATDEDARFTGVPALVVEVLAGDRHEDLALHRSKYATARMRPRHR
jgi:Uma2 family endonuclease